MKHTALLACLGIAISGLGVTSHATPVDLDATFLSGVGIGITKEGYPDPEIFGTGAVNAVGLQSNGKILAGGNVSLFQGTGDAEALRRLNSDGTLDTSFNSGNAGLAASSGSPEVNVIYVLSDDKILVGGTFSTYNGVSRSGIVKLNADGTLDTSFDTTGVGGTLRYVNDIEIQADGKVLISGGFSSVGGVVRSNIARLNTDGSVDTSFAPTLTSAAIYDMALAADGDIYVGGAYSQGFAQPTLNLLYRLNSDGSLDNGFSPDINDYEGDIDAIACLFDGRVVAGGNPYGYDVGSSTEWIAVFRSNGALDTTFDANLGGGTNGWVGGFIKQIPSGKILVGGIFNEIDGNPTASIARLNPDGTLDTGFLPEPYTTVRGEFGTHFYDVAIQPDGKYVVGGWFERVTDPDLEINNIVRFEGDDIGGSEVTLAASSFTYDESDVTLSIPVARYPAGSGAVSVEVSASALSFPGFSPVSETLTWADGESGVKYFDVTVTDNNSDDGVRTFTVSLSNASGAGLGQNEVATVTVRDDDSAPTITVQPSDVTVNQGYLFQISLELDSVLPTTVTWYVDDVEIATGARVTLTANQAAHQGTWHAVVTNENGSIQSDDAEVVINIPAGSFDSSFDVDATSRVISMVALPGGGFAYGGSDYLNAVDGDGDAIFSFSTDGSISSLAVDSSGNIYAVGSFTSVGGTAVTKAVRISPAGVIDTSFNPILNSSYVPSVISVAEDDKIFIGFNDTQKLKRFHTAGNQDYSFNGNFSTFNSITTYSILPLDDGSVLVGYRGYQSSFSFEYAVKKLDSNGNVVSDFTLDMNWYANRIIEIPGNRYAIFGGFTEVNGQDAERVMVIEADGSTAEDFSTDDINWPVLDGLYLDGFFWIVGNFTTIGGETSYRVARLNLDGSLNDDFLIGTGANYTVNAIIEDGANLVIGGDFTLLNDQPVNYLASLASGPGSAGFGEYGTEVLETVGTVDVQVYRFGDASGAASIDVVSIDGTATLGDGDYAAISETLTWATGNSDPKTVTVTISNDSISENEESFELGLSNPVGMEAGGVNRYVITVIDDDQKPIITTQPVPQSVTENDAVTFSVVAESQTNFTYQWYKVGEGAVPGATGSSFTIDPVALTDVGKYYVEITNSGGTTKSNEVGLSILEDPTKIHPSFNPGFTYTGLTLEYVAATSDNGAIIGGNFTNFNGTGKNYLFKAKPDGTVDTDWTVDSIVSGQVLRIVPDGDGYFICFNSYPYLTRIFEDGSLDTEFSTAFEGANASIYDVARMPNGNLLIGGHFSMIGSVARSSTAILESDYSLDSDYAPILSWSQYPYRGIVMNVAADENYVYLAGSLTHVDTNKNYFIRLTYDGKLDTTWNQNFYGYNYSLYRTSLLPQDNGEIIVSHGNVGTELLLNDGSRSSSYGNSMGGRVGVQANGQMVVARSAKSPYFWRLNADSSADTEFNTGIGAGPQGQAYDVSVAPDGSIWLVGRFAQFNNVTVPYYVRLQGNEILLNILTDPRSMDVNPGDTAEFSVIAYSNTTLSYQWYKDGNPLSDGADYSGTTTANLSVLDTEEADEGVYTVDVTSDAGTLTSEGADLIVLDDPEQLEPLTAQLLVEGDTLTLFTDFIAAAPYTIEWLHGDDVLADGGDISGATTTELTITNMALDDAGQYFVRVTNSFGSAETVPVQIDVIEPPAGLFVTEGYAYPNRPPQSILALPDGRVLVGSDRYASYTLLALNADLTQNVAGSLPIGLSGSFADVQAMVRQPDGKILIAGRFSSVDGETRNSIARLNSDLTLDDSFAPDDFTQTYEINALAVGPDGSIYAGGSMQPSQYLVKLLPDGSVDLSFSSPLNGTVNALEILPDGDLLAVGYFTTASNGPRITRLSPNGDIRESFVSPVTTSVSQIYDVAIHTDDYGLIGTGNNVIRFNLETGEEDTEFAASIGTTVTEVEVQSNGRIVVGGSFGLTIDGRLYKRLMRLEADGTLDTTFRTDPGQDTNNSATALEILPDGRIAYGSTFYTFNGVSGTYSNLVFLNGDPVELDIIVDPADVEVVQGDSATFEVFATGTTALSYQWYKNGGPLSDGGTINGATSSKLRLLSTNASSAGEYSVKVTNESGFVESESAELIFLGAPEFISLPASGDIAFGEPTYLRASVRGVEPISYQWYRDGEPLSEEDGVTGFDSDTLLITNPLPSFSGSFELHATNVEGTTESDEIQVFIVRDPARPFAAITVPEFNYYVRDFAFLDDGQVIAAGDFSIVTYPGGSASRQGLAIFGDDGVIDNTFPQARYTYSLSVDGSGRIYGGGNNSTPGRVYRIIDDPVEGWQFDDAFDTGSGPNSYVYKVEATSDNKVYIGGQFSSFNGSTDIAYFTRLNEDGSVDTTFTKDPLVSSTVRDFLVLDNGQILVAGNFSDRVLLLNSDGSVDESFDYGGISNYIVYSLAQQGNKFLVGHQYGYLYRVDSTGAVDTSFQSHNSYRPAYAQIEKMVVLPDNQILMSGTFTNYDGVAVNYFVRAEEDGSIDNDFDQGTGFNSNVYGLRVDDQGRIWVGGHFTSYDGDPFDRVVALNGDDPNAVPATPGVQDWLEQNFPEDERDLDYSGGGHGVTNLERWAYNMSATGFEPDQQPQNSIMAGDELGLTSDSREYWVITVRKRPEATDVQLSTVFSSDLATLSGSGEAGVLVSGPNADGDDDVYIYRSPKPIEDYGVRMFALVKLNSGR
ncbi:immunoglobulin domain-containing protein [Cerasicoccus maritimus]|uniref:immunoglobulin domain-containing protein n=1 Tax=Cerasicoccus maritimus TaxID=490089 RepID=UPI002852B84B|nr:immunoglobulin domain-containing protein [Cerasicoccus maritimus]